MFSVDEAPLLPYKFLSQLGAAANKVPVAQLDRVSASEADKESTQAADKEEVTNHPHTDTPKITLVD
ncbi:MAG: hypothetical protein ACYSSJ_05910, partial [Planctomycetota bacterium]